MRGALLQPLSRVESANATDLPGGSCTVTFPPFPRWVAEQLIGGTAE